MFFIKNVLTYVKYGVIVHLTINIKFFILRRNNMKEQAISKINKVGKASYIISKIAKIVFIIGLVVSIIGAIVCMVLPKNMVTFNMSGKMDMIVNLEKFDISEEDIYMGLEDGELDIKKDNITIGNIGTDVSIDIFEQEYNPVEVIQDGKTVLMKLESDSNSINLRDIGYFLIIVSVSMAITIVTLFFIESLCKSFKDCKSPFDEDVIKKMRNLAFSLIPFTFFSSIVESGLFSIMQGSVNFSLSIDLGVVLVVLIVFILAYIFKYGAVLQQESDETL